MPAAVTLTRAKPVDAPAIWALQRAAYQTEAALYGDPAIPPLTQTLDNLTAEFADKVFLKAQLAGRLVGSVRVQLRGTTVLLGRLIVAPECQRQGIGSALLRQAETVWPEAVRVELFTGVRSAGNLRLYERHGYTRYREEWLSEAVTLVYLEKALPPGARPAGMSA